MPRPGLKASDGGGSEPNTLKKWMIGVEWELACERAEFAPASPIHEQLVARDLWLGGRHVRESPQPVGGAWPRPATKMPRQGDGIAPALQRVKQNQRPLAGSTVNARGLSPPWIGHGPTSRSPLAHIRVSLPADSRIRTMETASLSVRHPPAATFGEAETRQASRGSRSMAGALRRWLSRGREELVREGRGRGVLS